MAGNNDAIYSKKGQLANNTASSTVQATGMNQLVLVAANDYTGAGVNNTLVFTADPVNGSFIQRLRFKAGGTNVQTVARIFINNGLVNTTVANNTFYGEATMPAVTASSSGATPDIDYVMNYALPPAFRIYVGYGTATAAGWAVTTVSGDY